MFYFILKYFEKWTTKWEVAFRKTNTYSLERPVETSYIKQSMNTSTFSVQRYLNVWPGKSRPNARQQNGDVCESDTCPKVHSKSTVIVNKRHKIARIPENLQGIFHQHAHHHMEPEEVRQVFVFHNPSISYEAIDHSEPNW